MMAYHRDKEIAYCPFCGTGNVGVVVDIAECKNDIENYYMRLPLDADGVPIRPGDRLETTDGMSTTFDCKSLYLCRDGWAVHGAVHGHRPDEVRHVKPDTVESILEEALDKAAMLDRGANTGYWPSAADITVLAKDYAERIRRCME
ncbi:MAG: hypothetical protein IJ113_03380 [Eggerthellaceae bacterium]|nr:hypothetical protein [Eggerthellaceae bacterium]